MLPSTVNRVPAHTEPTVNDRIRVRTEKSIARYRKADSLAVRRRLEELDAEWDIERTLEANASTVSLIGLALGATVDRRWYLFPTVVSAFLLQHALHGWCPPLPIFRRMGIRTSYEIDYERYALKEMIGDFNPSSPEYVPSESKKMFQSVENS